MREENGIDRSERRGGLNLTDVCLSISGGGKSQREKSTSISLADLTKTLWYSKRPGQTHFWGSDLPKYSVFVHVNPRAQ